MTPMQELKLHYQGLWEDFPLRNWVWTQGYAEIREGDEPEEAVLVNTDPLRVYSYRQNKDIVVHDFQPHVFVENGVRISLEVMNPPESQVGIMREKAGTWGPGVEQ